MQESSANAYVPELDETLADDFRSTPINRDSPDPSAGGLGLESDNLHDGVAGLIALSGCERPLMRNDTLVRSVSAVFFASSDGQFAADDAGQADA